jgi:hypothetical protein
MSTYNDDFSTDTAGAAPSGWTARWTTTNSTWTVQTDSSAIGGKRMRHTAMSTARRLLSWDAIDADVNRADTEIVARLRASQKSDYQNRLYLRCAGAAGTETGYFAGIHASNGLVLFCYLNGTSTQLATSPYPWQANTWYWIRFRVQGTSIKSKIWGDNELEPAAWTLEMTDSSISAAGWTGVGAYELSGNRDFDYVAVGTGGEAPVLDPGSLRLTQSVLEILSSPTPPPLRATQLVVEQVRQPHPPLRITQAVAEVVIATVPPGLHYYQQVLEMVVKRVPVLQVHQWVLEMVVKRPQHAISSGQPRRGSVAT